MIFLNVLFHIFKRVIFKLNVFKRVIFKLNVFKRVIFKRFTFIFKRLFEPSLVSSHSQSRL